MIRSPLLPSPSASRRPRRLLAAVLGAVIGAAVVVPACSPATPPPQAAARTVRFDVQGMTCDGCRAAIAARIAKVDGVAACTVSLEDHEAVAEVTDDEAIDRIIESVSSMNYTIERKTDAPSAS